MSVHHLDRPMNFGEPFRQSWGFQPVPYFPTVPPTEEERRATIAARLKWAVDLALAETPGLIGGAIVPLVVELMRQDRWNE